MGESKECTKCGILKGLGEFYKGERYQDGHQNACKKCKIEQQRIYYMVNKERIIEYHHKRYNTHKVEILKKQHVYRREHKEQYKDYQLIYHKDHKAAIKEQTRKYREEHKEAISRQRRGYRILHKRTAANYIKLHKVKLTKQRRERDSTPHGKALIRRHRHTRRARQKATETTLTSIQWAKILTIQNNRCNVCGKRFTAKRSSTTDHIIPLSAGGGLTFENVQALCRSCNSHKNSKLDPQFIQTWL